MAQDSKEVVLEAHREVSTVLARVAAQRSRSSPKVSSLRDRGAAISEPARFWAGWLQSSESPSIDSVTAGVRLVAAKLRAGDIGFVYEHGVGQVAWLSTIAIELKADADKLPLDSPKRVRLIELSMRAQSAAAKLMMSMAALVQFQPKHP
jgi:hypothetical protein